MQASTGLAGLSLLGAYNSDSDSEEDDGAPRTNWGICSGAKNASTKIPPAPYYWNLANDELTWTMPKELEQYLAYVESHKDDLIQSYGDKRWTTHSGTNNTFYLDELYRTVTYEMPVHMQRNASQDITPSLPPSIQSVPRTTPSPPSDEKSATKSKDSLESDRSYSPPPLFANVPTTVTLEDIAAAAGEGGVTETQINRKRRDDEEERNETLNKRINIGQDVDRNASKRRRRIEIPRVPKKENLRNKNISKEEDRTSTTPPLDDGAVDMNKVTMTGQDKKMSKESYLNNFCAGGIEIISTDNNLIRMQNGKATSAEDSMQPLITTTSVNGNEEQRNGAHLAVSGSMADNGTATGSHCGSPADQVDPEEQMQQRTEIKSIADLVSGKMKFLSEGRPAVSGVQAMAIQLETLTSAYEESALAASYLQRWLRGTAEKLQQLEKEVAPVGWNCKWDRDSRRYFYECTATGKRQWEFPQSTPDVVAEEEVVNDEMDICTTPPHESSVQFEEVSVGVVVNAQPPLPLTPLLQPPLPPPQDNGDCGEPRVKPPLPPTAVPTEVCTVDMIAAYPQIPTMTNSAGLAWNGMLPVAVAAPMVHMPLVGNQHPVPASIGAYEIPSAVVASSSSGHSTERLNSELDSFYSDIASIECNQVAETAPLVDGEEGKQTSNGSSAIDIHPPLPPVSVDMSSSSSANNKGTVDKVSKAKKKKVKTSLSDIKDMSHLISKWQKAQQDL